jgi:hypothetical protein
LLFSGIDDKDSESSVPEILNFQFTLDTINSLSWFAVIKRLKCNNTKLVIIPAWTFFVAPCLLHLACCTLLVAPCLGFITKQCQKFGNHHST